MVISLLKLWDNNISLTSPKDALKLKLLLSLDEITKDEKPIPNKETYINKLQRVNTFDLTMVYSIYSPPPSHVNIFTNYHYNHYEGKYL